MSKKVVKRGSVGKKLTPAEREVLQLITVNYYTPAKVAARRGTSRQAVSKLVRSLKLKGAINAAYEVVDKTRGTCQPCQPFINVHGQEYNIKLLNKSNKFLRVFKKANLIYIDGNTVRLYKDSIEVYVTHRFEGRDVHDATRVSMAYLSRFLARLEHELGVIVVKPRSANIKLVKAHYAEAGNELAIDCQKKGDMIKVYGSDDGQLWFTIDNSFNLKEAETQHSKRSKQDMGDVVAPFFNDLRDKEPPKLSDVWLVLNEITQHEKEIAAGILSLLEVMKPKRRGPDLPRAPQPIPDYVG